MHKEQNLKLGIFYIILSSFLFAMMGVFSKSVVGNASIFVQLFMRFLFNLLFLIPAMLKDFRTLAKVDTPQHFSLLTVRNIAGILSIAFTFYAIKKLTVTNAVLLNSTASLFVPFIIWIGFGIKTTPKVMLGSLIGFIGVILVLGPSGKIFQSASLIGLAAGMLSAIALVMVREISKSYSTERVLFYYSVTGTLIFSFFLPSENWHPYTTQTWLQLLGLGLSGALYQVFITHALGLAPVRILSSLNYMAIIFSAILGWLIWREKLEIINLVGISLVIGGGITTVFFGKKLINPNR